MLQARTEAQEYLVVTRLSDVLKEEKEMKKWKSRLSFILAVAMVMTNLAGTCSVTAFATEGDEVTATTETVETVTEETVTEDTVEETPEYSEESYEAVEESEQIDESQVDENQEISNEDEENSEDSEELDEGSEETEELDEESEDETKKLAEDAADENTIVITYSVNNEDFGYIDGESKESFTIDSEYEIQGATAVANEGYEFVNWTCDGEEVSTDATFVPSNIEESVEFVANFEEAEVEEETEEIVITYEVNDEEFGAVDNDIETFESEDDETEIVGATATPATEDYKFINWTDEDGEVVCEEATFVPTEKVTATYTANFEEVVEKEAVFNTVRNGINITVLAHPGTFPEGTEMVVKIVSNSEVVDAVDAATDYEVDSSNIIAFDISFKSEGEEIQPAKPVKVTFQNVDLEGRQLDVFHMEDSNSEAEPVATVENSSEVEFEAESFSVYVVVGSESHKVYDSVVVEKGKTITIYCDDYSSDKNDAWTSNDNSIVSVEKTNAGPTNRPAASITGKKLERQLLFLNLKTTIVRKRRILFRL